MEKQTAEVKGYGWHKAKREWIQACPTCRKRHPAAEGNAGEPQEVYFYCEKCEGGYYKTLPYGADRV